jgi:serine/threonine protein kinase
MTCWCGYLSIESILHFVYAAKLCTPSDANKSLNTSVLQVHRDIKPENILLTGKLLLQHTTTTTSSLAILSFVIAS